MVTQTWAIVLVFCYLHGLSVFTSPDSGCQLKDALETRGTVIFSPRSGTWFGDPTNFKVDDCATQRNLDRRGREQSGDR